MKDREYYRQVSKLIDEMNCREKEIMQLAIDVDDEFAAEEARKVSEWLFRLWEAVAHYKGKLRRLEELESERYEEMKHRRTDSWKD